MRIAVSGTRSSIGRAVVREMLDQGIEILHLNRTGIGERFDLASPIKLGLGNIDSFVHLAWDWTELNSESHKRNVQNILPFLDSLDQRNIKMVLLSSESASGIPSSNYGKVKRELEQEFLARNGSSIRAGLLWGSNLSGIVATICRLSQMPFFCAHLSPDPTFFVSNESEIARAIVSQAVGGQIQHQIMSLRSSNKVRLSEISHCYQGSRKRVFHMHLGVKKIILITAKLSSTGFKLPFRVDSLRSLLGAESNVPEAGIGLQLTSSTTEDFFLWLQEKRNSQH